MIPSATLPAPVGHEGADAPSALDEMTAFTRAVRAAFLAALAECGSVRRAARAAGVSHQTAYRARRACAVFRRGWDAALIAARACAEDVLATRALEGVEEAVFYHGEVIATRRRYSDRLLLAHLGRLDKLTANARANAFAEDFDGALERFAAGSDTPETAPAAEGADLPSGQCNTRSTAEAGEGVDGAAEPLVWCPFEREMVDPGTAQLNQMDSERPEGVLAPCEMEGVDEEEVECAQMAAHTAGEDRWYLAMPPENYAHGDYRIAEMEELQRLEDCAGARAA